MSFNNFYCNFPGERYGSSTNEQKLKLFQAIDELIEQTGFDLTRFQRITKIIHRSANKGQLIFRTMNEALIKHYFGRAEKHQKLISEMIESIYERLLEQGYAIEDLIR